jgi:porphobilinogen synthase
MMERESTMNIYQRPRRLRMHSNIREMIEEVSLSPRQLIAPLFLLDGKKKCEPIQSLKGHSRLSIDLILKEIDLLQDLGIKSIVLFPVLEASLKNDNASKATEKNFFYLKAIKEIKTKFPEICIVTDVALDPYTSHGHDGLVDPKTEEVLNDKTLEILALMSLLQAEAGADIIAPSDMMDGRVGAIRGALESKGFKNTLIMSYCTKYASSFYGPFRDALSSAPKKGDKKSYQMNYKMKSDIFREVQLDTEEGADILMVKPALSYLDIIHRIKEVSTLPVAAYQVSGEYAMIQACAEKKWGDAEQLMLECLFSIRRAGADLILSYFGKTFAQWHKRQM